MKIDKKIAKGKVAVISKNGKAFFVKEAKNKGLLIEGDESWTVEEKYKNKLTAEEKKKLK